MLSLTDPQKTEDTTQTDPDIASLEELGGTPVQNTEPEPPSVEDPPQSTEDDLPEKYRNKSLVDVVRMHQEAEKQIGRQGHELGMERKDKQYYQAMLDQMISNQTVSEPAAPVEEVDFFENPEKAVRDTINKELDQNPALAEAKALRAEVTRQSTLNQLNKNHPDWQDVAQDDGFGEWVRASQFRVGLAQRADQYDYDAANELFTLYKERASVQKVAEQQQTQQRQEEVQKASTGSTQSTGETKGKRTFRQSDIIELMKSDPVRYRTLEKEIASAFREGRVVMDRGVL